MRYNKLVVSAFFLEEDLPPPVFEFRFHPTRKWRWDICWPEQKIAIEVQGGLFQAGRHIRGAGYLNDMEKWTEGTLLGWRMIWVSPMDLCMVRTTDRVKRLLEEGAWA
jgi:hypothetical protein